MLFHSIFVPCIFVLIQSGGGNHFQKPEVEQKNLTTSDSDENFEIDDLSSHNRGDLSVTVVSGERSRTVDVFSKPNQRGFLLILNLLYFLLHFPFPFQVNVSQHLWQRVVEMYKEEQGGGWSLFRPEAPALSHLGSGIVREMAWYYSNIQLKQETLKPAWDKIQSLWGFVLRMISIKLNFFSLKF